MVALDAPLVTWTNQLIRRQAKRLAQCRHHVAEDEDDYAQELTLAVWRSLATQTPEVVTLGWLTTVVQRTAGMINRRRWAKKRTTARPLRSLARHAGLLAEASPPAEDEVERRLDIAAMLQRLPVDDQQLATQLQSQSIREVAMQQGLASSTLRRRLERLRRAFEDAGLAIYV